MIVTEEHGDSIFGVESASPGIKELCPCNRIDLAKDLSSGLIVVCYAQRIIGDCIGVEVNYI